MIAQGCDRLTLQGLSCRGKSGPDVAAKRNKGLTPHFELGRDRVPDSPAQKMSWSSRTWPSGCIHHRGHIAECSCLTVWYEGVHSGPDLGRYRAIKRGRQQWPTS